MEEQYQKRFIVEDLDLEDTSLEEILTQKESEFMGQEDLNIFYSYPYFPRGVFDFLISAFVALSSESLTSSLSNILSFDH